MNRAQAKHVRLGVPAQADSARREQRDVLQQQKAALVRRTISRLGLTDQQVANETGVDRGQVTRWRNGKHIAAPTLINLVNAPQGFVDELLQALAEIRANNGHARRSWVALDRDDSTVTELEELKARVDAALVRAKG